MHFVYIIKSTADGSYYTGITEDIEKRLDDHNSGTSKYSSSKRPFVLAWYCAFHDKQLAYRFEKYLKSGSGIAFRNKRFLDE